MKYKQSSDSSSFHSFLRTTTLFLISALLINSCSEQSITPKEILKDPKEMTWTADTINNPIPNVYQTLMDWMYAASPNNIYLAGHSDSRAQIWHYNGTKWDYIDYVDQLGAYRIISLYGFSEKSIWFCGNVNFSIGADIIRKCCVLQYNGSVWKLHTLDGEGRIIRIGGDRENNIWAVGDSGIVFNYNGTTWKKDYVNVNAPIGSSYFINGVVVMNNIVYLTIHLNDKLRKRYIHYFVKGGIGNWSIVDSMYLENPSSVIKFGNRGLYLSKDGELFSYGLFGLWKYNGNGWDKLINIDTDLTGIFSYKKNYIIAVGHAGYVFYYDGSIWTKLERFYRPEGGLNMYDAWTEGKEVLLLGNLVDKWPMKTIVYRGK